MKTGSSETFLYHPLFQHQSLRTAVVEYLALQVDNDTQVIDVDTRMRVVMTSYLEEQQTLWVEPQLGESLVITLQCPSV